MKQAFDWSAAIFSPMLSHPIYSAASLVPLPRSRWLNPTAPAIKQGKIQPDQVTDDELLHAMCSDPLLIRRPLVQQGIKKWVGFDWDTLRGELGVDTDQESKLAGQDLETCARTKS